MAVDWWKVLGAGMQGYRDSMRDAPGAAAGSIAGSLLKRRKKKVSDLGPDPAGEASYLPTYWEDDRHEDY